MRVLAVAERLGQAAAKGAELRRRFGKRVGEPVGDRGVIGRRARKGLRGKPPAQRQRCRPAMRVQFCGHGPVITRIDHHGDVGMVLGGGAYERGTANVDGFDALFEAAASRGGLLEGIEIDQQQVDRGNCVLRHGPHMLAVAAYCQEAAMEHRMQRLDAAIHHFRELRDLGDFAHREAGRGQDFRRAPGRDQFDAELRQKLGEFGEPGLVRNRQQGPGNTAEHVGHVEAFSIR